MAEKRLGVIMNAAERETAQPQWRCAPRPPATPMSLLRNGVK